MTLRDALYLASLSKSLFKSSNKPEFVWSTEVGKDWRGANIFTQVLSSDLFVCLACFLYPEVTFFISNMQQDEGQPEVSCFETTPRGRTPDWPRGDSVHSTGFSAQTQSPQITKRNVSSDQIAGKKGAMGQYVFIMLPCSASFRPSRYSVQDPQWSVSLLPTQAKLELKHYLLGSRFCILPPGLTVECWNLQLSGDAPVNNESRWPRACARSRETPRVCVCVCV